MKEIMFQFKFNRIKEICKSKSEFKMDKFNSKANSFNNKCK